MARRRAVDAEAELNLPPGFRFHPTDEELVVHYLCKKVAYQRLPVPIIAEVDLYKYDPWQLPEKALFGQQEWYFFTPRDRKYPNGSRPNRTAGTGYWKATGADKPVAPKGRTRPVGIKKALVFYSGKAPRGVKTDWIMHEYRLADTDRTVANKKGNLRLDEWVLCRLYHKKNNWVMKQEEEEKVTAATTMVSSFEETTTMDSFGGAVDDTGSDSFCRSDIENESFFHPPQAYNGAQGAARASIAEVQVKEDNDWFMDFNLDDLQSPFGHFGSSTTTTADMTNQDYFFQVLDSPQMRRTLPNLPPF